jgi:putative ubiquitin-RnfH superfamily antitoxin RatB of RatAB toxin-antitoxin module
MREREMIAVEVVYALPRHQTRIRMSVKHGTTVGEAITASGVVHHHPEIVPDCMQVGIYGKRVKLTRALEDSDRIEIYRPLTADPGSARRKRARKRSGR